MDLNTNQGEIVRTVTMILKKWAKSKNLIQKGNHKNAGALTSFGFSLLCFSWYLFSCMGKYILSLFHLWFASMNHIDFHII